MTLLTSGQLHQGRPSSSVMVRISSNMKSKMARKILCIKNVFCQCVFPKTCTAFTLFAPIIPFHSIRQLLMMLITMGLNNRPASKGI